MDLTIEDTIDNTDISIRTLPAKLAVAMQAALIKILYAIISPRVGQINKTGN